jgi:predicted site-specific integrase-resolvase
MKMTTLHIGQRELAKRWGISPRTLERWRWSKEGPNYVRLGGRVVYRMEDVEAFETAKYHNVQAERSTPVAKGTTR